MKRIAYLLALVGVITLTGMSAYRGAQLFSVHRSLRAERTKLEAARADLARAQAERAESLRQASDLAAGSSASPAAIAEISREAERQEEINDWLGRLRRIRDLFARHPEATIPEMSMMTENQWLGSARDLDFSDEESERTAMAAVRSRAKMEFGSLLSQALRKYATATGGMLPASVDQLQPYFDRAVPAGALARYQMRASGRAAEVFAGLDAIVECAPVDAEFDQRLFIRPSGGFGTMPWAGSEIQEGTMKALAAFRKANPGVDPNTVPDVTAYADPKVQSYHAALSEYRKTHNGADPDRPEQLLPYVTDPATRATVEALAKAKRHSEKR